ncbi:MAG: hypothetical protein A4E45_00219 [Methanosaeta sp. PtaB.Bin039]|nr:MAG: hypothetical protein A4E45_00219 [Methanosaeta sp. PtaB.Bin039]
MAGDLGALTGPERFPNLYSSGARDRIRIPVP